MRIRNTRVRFFFFLLFEKPYWTCASRPRREERQQIWRIIIDLYENKMFNTILYLFRGVLDRRENCLIGLRVVITTVAFVESISVSKIYRARTRKIVISLRAQNELLYFTLVVRIAGKFAARDECCSSNAYNIAWVCARKIRLV